MDDWNAHFHMIIIFFCLKLGCIPGQSDFSESESSSRAGSDPEYNPPQTASSSSDQEDSKIPDKVLSCECLSSDEDEEQSSPFKNTRTTEEKEE